jgi:hypothetical protein
MDANTALTLARAAYESSTTYFDSSIRAQIEADLRQFQGQHPAGSKYNLDAYKSRSRLFRPKTRAAIRKNEAACAEAFFATNDALSVTAEDESDPFNVCAADLYKYLMQARLTHPDKGLPWFLMLLGAYQDAQTQGIVISRQYWDTKADRPMIKLIPVENFRFSPGAEWYDAVNTSPYTVELIPMYVKDVMARMKPAAAGLEPKWLPLPEADVLSASRLADSTRQTRDGPSRTDAKDQTVAHSPYTIVWVHRNIVEHDGEDWIYYTLTDQKLLSKPVRLADVVHHGKRDYVAGFCVVETHKIYPSGVSRITKDVQRETNDLANLRIDNVYFAMNKRYFVKRNKQVDLNSLRRNVPGSATLMNDPETDVKVVETNDVTASAFQEQDRLNNEFDDVAGVFSAGSVQSNRAMNDTVGGMQLLSTGANQINAYQLRTFIETWVERVLRQVLLLIREYETDEELVALAARNAKVQEELKLEGPIDPMLLDQLLDAPVSLLVNVGMNASNPAMKLQNFIGGVSALKAVIDAGLERYGMKFREVIREVFGLMGYRDGARFFDFDSEDPVVSALLVRLQELQQALEMKHPEELIKAQVEQLMAAAINLRASAGKAHANQVESGVKASFEAVQAAAQIVQVPQLAPVADKILEGAGYAPDPAGVDPNLPQPEISAPALVPPANQNTSPQLPPVPASPAAGIETSGMESPV